MARVRVVQGIFNAGELSPRMQDRADLQTFFEGAASLKNLIVLREGGGIRRSGTVKVADAQSNASPSRLIPFVKSTDDAVMLEWSNLHMRAIGAGDFALLKESDGVTVLDLTTPYAAADLDNLYTWQSADVMWVTLLDGSKQPRSLIRYADDDWEIDTFECKSGPFLGRNNDAAGAISVSNFFSTVSLTASRDTFTAGHVGSRWRFWQTPSQAPYKRWAAEEDLGAANQVREYAGRVYLAASSGICGNQPPVHEEGLVSDGGVSWSYLHDGAGVVRITAVTDARNASGTVEERLPVSGSYTYWAEGAFSDERGWPRIGGVFEERMIFLSTASQPDTFHASRTAEYTPLDASFKPGMGTGEVVDSDAIRRTLADAQVNRPSWLIASDQLMFGTPNGIVRVSGPSLDEALVPASAVARRLPRSIGADPRCRAVEAAAHILYPARGGRRMIELEPVNGESRDLTLRAEHVGASPIVQTAWLGEPDGRLFALREDGALFCMAYVPAEGVIGWSPIVIAGRYLTGPAIVESIAAAPDAVGRDRLWLTVRRTADGVVKRTIEVLEPDFRLDRQHLDEACMMDAAVKVDQWNADAAKTVTLSMTGGVEPHRGNMGTLVAVGHSPFTGMTGKEIWLHARSQPPAASDPPAPMRLVIRSVASGSQCGVEVLSDGTDAQLSTSQWAFPVAEISGLDHLEGETVIVQGDGAELGAFEVSGGAVDLGENIARGCAGLETDWRGVSMPIVLAAARGDSRGALIRVEAMRVGYVDAVSARIRVISGDAPQSEEDLISRSNTDPLGVPLRPRSGQSRIVVSAQRGRKVQIEVFGAGAMPFTLTSVSAEVAVDD